MSFLTLLEALNFNFSNFEPFPKSQICQNSKLRVSEIVKKAIFEIQILPKLFSLKIEWQINSCIVDLNFTFWKFLEHSAVLRTCFNPLIAKSSKTSIRVSLSGMIPNALLMGSSVWKFVYSSFKISGYRDWSTILVQCCQL